MNLSSSVCVLILLALNQTALSSDGDQIRFVTNYQNFTNGRRLPEHQSSDVADGEIASGSVVIDSDRMKNNNASSWRFITLSDMHTMARFSWSSIAENKQQQSYKDQLVVLQHIHENYGGELILSPGDIASYGGISYREMKENLGLGDISNQKAVYTSHLNSFKTAKELFREAGYNTLLATIGDHELGDNEGFRPNSEYSKLDTIVQARKAFGDGFNRNQDNDFISDQPHFFNNVQSRPIGTEYENTSFAYVHKNSLFVTVDAYQIVGDGTSDYIDRKNGKGGEGAITGTVDGDGWHLKWFENVLRKGKSAISIDHIIVQAHLPVIRPVQSIHCSGQFFDKGEDSEFWKLMNEYGVDLYLAGEVHGNTATKTTFKGSDLVQIVSRGNSFNNFLSIDVSEKVLNIKIHNEIGTKPKFNGDYVEVGHLTIDKTLPITKLSSSGRLELVDSDSATLAYDFDNIVPLGTRQIPGFSDSNNLMITEIDIRGKVCNKSILNRGSFGAQYDAQVGNIGLVPGINDSHAGYFNGNSRMAMIATGPLSAGEVFSFGLWFMTWKSDKKMILVHHGNYWGSYVSRDVEKDFFTLILDRGIPVIHTRPMTEHRSTHPKKLADGQWHHIAVSMPRKSCKVSDLEIYIDGNIVGTSTKNDRHIFHTTSGRMSLGGFGYSNPGFEDAYPDYVPYIGSLDDFILYNKPIVNLSSHFCLDNNSFVFDRIFGGVGNCAWLTKNMNNTKERKQTYCSRAEIRSECPSTCEICQSVFAPNQSDSPSGAHSSCKDDNDSIFVSDSGGIINCNWITKSEANVDARKARYCNRKRVQKLCPNTCEQCRNPGPHLGACVDDPNYTFNLRNGSTKRCTWLVMNSTKADGRKIKYCTAIGASCRKSCGYCA